MSRFQEPALPGRETRAVALEEGSAGIHVVQRQKWLNSSQEQYEWGAARFAQVPTYAASVA